MSKHGKHAPSGFSMKSQLSRSKIGKNDKELGSLLIKYINTVKTEPIYEEIADIDNNTLVRFKKIVENLHTTLGCLNLKKTGKINQEYNEQNIYDNMSEIITLIVGQINENGADNESDEDED